VTTAEETLSSFVEGVAFDALPPDVASLIQLHVLDALACWFAGAHAEHADEVREVAATLGQAGAVLVNGFQIAAPTLGDVHRKTLTHVMPEVLPAALAASLALGSDGAAFLAGVCAGMEVTVRVAEALDTDAYRERGFHNPGIAGAVGAACAAARVMALNGEQTRVAIGHAASMAGGTFAALGTDGVKAHQARGGVSGFLAAQLAAAGIGASQRGLTAARGGLLAAYADGGQPERLTDGLATAWRLRDIALRRWPGASSLQPVIEATLSLRDEIGAAAAESVEVALPRRAFALNATSGWDTSLAALQSARWTVAVALADGEIWLDQTSDGRRDDAAVAAFARDCVSVREDESLRSTGARVTIETRDGGRMSRVVETPPGDPARPLTRHEVESKVTRASPQRAQAIIDAVDRLASALTLETLTALLEVR
jgi:2-methylcitrate dehydratase PrpD